MEIIDNFIPEDQFYIIHKTMYEDDFEWFFTDKILTPPYENLPGRYQFCHNILSDREGISSYHYPILNPILSKLGTYKLFRIKANLTLATHEHEPSGYHVDGFDKNHGYPDNTLTAIYYINTCNGYTEFKTGEKVKSVSNRMLIFNSELEHQGVTSTDETRRVLINFNFIKHLDMQLSLPIC